LSSRMASAVSEAVCIRSVIEFTLSALGYELGVRAAKA
jgi:hypothetical protein